MKNSSSKILLVGDFNSRTGELEEYEEPDKTDEHLIPRERIPTKRANCDKGTNQMGERLIGLCKSHDLQILNGRTNGDLHGNFTFYDTKDGASTIDIAVVSDPLLPQIKSFVVCRQDEISKHCKVIVRIKNLKTTSLENTTEDTYSWIPITPNYKWNDASAISFAMTLQSEELANTITECEQYLDAGLIEPASDKIEELFTKAADIALIKPKEPRVRHPYKHKQKPKKWYNKECRDLKTL